MLWPEHARRTPIDAAHPPAPPRPAPPRPAPPRPAPPRQFYDKIVADPLTAPFFKNIDMKKQRVRRADRARALRVAVAAAPRRPPGAGLPRPRARRQLTAPPATLDPSPLPPRPAPWPRCAPQAKQMNFMVLVRPWGAGVRGPAERLPRALARHTATLSGARRPRAQLAPARPTSAPPPGQALGGPNDYKGRSMAEAHAGMGLTDKHFDAVAGHFVATLKELGVADGLVAEAAAVVESTRDQVRGAARAGRGTAGGAGRGGAGRGGAGPGRAGQGRAGRAGRGGAGGRAGRAVRRHAEAQLAALTTRPLTPRPRLQVLGRAK
jgi:truncated hemoglobin YjbI